MNYGELALDEFLDMLDENGELPPLDDCPSRFDGYKSAAALYGRSNTQFQGEEPIEEYGDYISSPATRALARGAPATFSHYGESDQFLDEIEDLESSDPSGYGLSSPTPVQPRGLHTTVRGTRRLPLQQVYSATHDGNTNESYAYKQSDIGDACDRMPRYTKDTFASERFGEQSRGNNPRNAHNLRLRPVSELPDIYSGIFKFGVFNAVQSKCYQSIMDTTENLVVSAPTGCGKTVLFELGIIAMLMSSGHGNSSKFVYVAPTKALCSERTKDWSAKFEPLGIKCCEITGDTVQLGKSAWASAKTAKIIITTSEKWDSLTRGWHDHDDFLSEVKLFLVDEVHVLNESRGSTLEVIVSRMKTHSRSVRFILVSATVPNIRDIADWIGNPSINPSASATVYEFGEEYRPCKITRHVYGYPRKNQNDFQFSRTLDYRLYSVLEQHACGKPVLIFCSTRKGALSTAEQLLKEYDDAVAKKHTTAWSPPRQLNRTFLDKRLEKLAKAGLGVHHAGLALDDRRTTEELYLNGSLRVVCATSTLAVGVNLPAHTVVIKGVKLYVANSWQEYSDLDVIQMIGRAGRPQFDKDGVAIIMCEQELESKYRNLAQGRTILESSLHENLLEHINSEIGIGAITDIESAKDWLRNSFLRQRIQRNPGRYHIGKTAGQTWEEKMDDLVLQAVNKLESNELISTSGHGNAALSVTEYGDIMSKYYIRHSTMASIFELPERPGMREILEVISCAEELGDVSLRGGDKQVYNKMKDLPDIRFKIKKVEKASDKVFILIQAVLGGVSLSASDFKTSDSQPVLDALSVFRHVVRIARVVVEVAIVKKNGAQIKHGLELTRCLTAKAWEDRPVVLKQIESIGEKSLKMLAQHGITSLQALRKQEPSRIEMLLNRRPPYGHEILQFVQDMPQYGLSLKVSKNGICTYAGRKPVTIELCIGCYLLREFVERKKGRTKSRLFGMTNVLTITSDLNLIDFRRISTKTLRDSRTFTVTAELTKPSQTICVLISSDNFAGLTVTENYKPCIPAREYPTMDTQPRGPEYSIVEECERDPNFLQEYDDLEEKVTPAASPAPSRPPLEPRVLPNGNYACNHNCKDKDICRHLCCREGTRKPPTASKNVLLQKSTENRSTAMSRKNNEQKAKSSKKPEKHDKSLEQLESLHELSGVQRSLGLGTGKRLTLDDGLHARNATPATTSRLDVANSRLSDEDSDDMPNVKELLTSVRQTNSPDDSFSDPELGAIMMTMYTLTSPADIPDESATNLNALKANDPEYLAIQKKRKQLDAARLPGSPKPIEPAAKKAKLESEYPTREHADNSRLFLSSPQPTSFAAPNATDSNDDGYMDEDYFALNDSILTVIPSNSDVQNAMTVTKENATRDNVSKAVPDGELKQVEGKASDADHYDYGRDDWADMEAWLNSGSVQIVG